MPETGRIVTVTIRLLTSPGHRGRLLETFRPLVGPTIAAAGCLGCRLLENVQDPDELTLVEEWRSRESFEAHVRSRDFRRILCGIELADRPPEVRIQTGASIRGMDCLEEILSARQATRTPGGSGECQH